VGYERMLELLCPEAMREHINNRRDEVYSNDNH